MTKLGPLQFLDSFHQAASTCLSLNQKHALRLEMNSDLQVESFLSCLPSIHAAVSSFLPQCYRNAIALGSDFACASKNTLWRFKGQMCHCSMCLDGNVCLYGEVGEKCCVFGQRRLQTI